MKSICALVHRDDLDRQTFQNHYETCHAPLAVQHFPFRRYVRNHFIDGEDIGYDTISEFWADDILASAELMHGPVGVLMRADEERFMNRALTAPASAVEYILSAGAPACEDGRRVAALIDWTMPDDEGRALLKALGFPFKSED